MGKAAVGVTGTLSRYGIIVDQADLKTRGFAAVVDEMNKNFGGTAQALVSGYAGQLGMLSKAWDDVTKAVAENITKSPEVIALFQTMTTEIDLLTKSIGENSDLIEQVIATTMAKLIDTLNTLGPTLQRTVVLWNLLQIATHLSTQQSWKAVGQFDDLWDAVAHGQEKLESITTAIQRMTDTWELNAKVNRRLNEIRKASIEQLPELRAQLEGLQNPMTQFYDNTGRSAEVVAALEQRIRDLTATTEKARAAFAVPLEMPKFGYEGPPPEETAEDTTEETELARWARKIEMGQEFYARRREMQMGYWDLEQEQLDQEYEYYAQFMNNKVALDQWYAERKAEIDAARLQEFIGNTAAYISELRKGGMASAQLAKRAAQVEVFVDTLASAQKAYKAYAYFPPLAIAAAAAATVLGMARLKAIQKQKFALGGWIGGFGGGDRELFYGSPGEFVVRPGPARANAGPLEDMNRGAVPAYTPKQTTIQTELTVNVTGFDAQGILESAQHGPIREAFQEALDRQYLTVKELVQ